MTLFFFTWKIKCLKPTEYNKISVKTYKQSEVKLMKIFATAKILWVKQALSPAAGKKIFWFSVAICINCIGKMLIWGHFRGIMELSLNNYLGNFLIIGNIFVFLFIQGAIMEVVKRRRNSSEKQLSFSN